MELYSENKEFKLYHGSMLDMLEVIEPKTIDSIVTDPPYELNFMNKGWDNSGIAFQKTTWEKCYQVLKPGGYLLAFGGSRTFHRIACAIEDAGFEIRDTIMWLYGSGFPKSMSISKGIEAKEKYGKAGTSYKRMIEQSCDGEEYTVKQTNNGAMGEIYEATRKEYIPTSDIAKKWTGWGTALKPAYEPIIVARKPCEGSCIDNVLMYGVGGINIDACRVGDDVITTCGGDKFPNLYGNYNECRESQHEGRYPSNVILTYDETDQAEVCGGMPETKSTQAQGIHRNNRNGNTVFSNTSCGFNNSHYDSRKLEGFDDDGSAARYYYCAKASKRDRDEGLEDFAEAKVTDGNTRTNHVTANKFGCESALRRNIHPTVKPCDLMQYLVRLVTPPCGTVLDPFNGSGSTGKACMYENKDRNAGYKYIGIELTAEYLPIADARIKFASGDNAPISIPEKPMKGQVTFFDLLEQA